MNHDEVIRKILSQFHATGYLKARESNTIEFKEAFNKNSTANYAKTMAAYANHNGGYIIFGVKDNPREVVGLKSNNFDNLKQEVFTDAINSLFTPSMNWESGTLVLTVDTPGSGKVGEDEHGKSEVCIGWVYTTESDFKPVIAQKTDGGEKISSGDVFYRYRARSEKIRYAEMNRIIEDRAKREREGTMKLLEVIRKSETANLGIVNYGSGKMTTPYGVDVYFDRKLVAEVLKKAKFIKEGSFSDTDGAPVIKVTGEIDMVEEVPVPEIDPDKGYPYIQKDLAEMLNVSTQDLYALIHYYRMKEAKKYAIGVTTSRNGRQNFKFSEHSYQFLKEKLTEPANLGTQLELIRSEYKNRNNRVRNNGDASAPSPLRQAPCARPHPPGSSQQHDKDPDPIHLTTETGGSI
ncbi:MAG: ATP-binding protein [Christensenellales bacterium]